MNPRTILCSLVFTAIMFANQTADAVEGEPVAIVRLAGGVIAIETMWNLTVVIDDSSSGPATRADLTLSRETSAKQNEKSEAKYRHHVTADDDTEYVLDRVANEESVTWQPRSEVTKASSNAVSVRMKDDVVFVKVDGVQIAHVAKLEGNLHEVVRDSDVLVFDGDNKDNAKATQLAKDTNVRFLILKTGEPTAPSNTLAVAANPRQERGNTEVVILAQAVPSLREEVAELFKRKESACTDSQAVFAKLSTNQMNFRPANGSHTPRWNAEHMMGRELLFFSQIYHAVDPSIPVMDLNPQQMPPDYRAKHADWTGKEEARQMQRVSAFTRRFAHLLKDIPMDKRAPGSGWTLRRLLLQMERHYNDHTANVKKKFLLDNWPSE